AAGQRGGRRADLSRSGSHKSETKPAISTLQGRVSAADAESPSNRSSCGVTLPTRSQRVDDGDVQTDDDERPQRIAGRTEPAQLTQDVHAREKDRHPPRPTGTPGEGGTYEHQQDPEDQGEPAPRPRIEDDDLAAADDEVLAAHDSDQSLEEIERADDHHHDRRERDPS